MAKKPTKKKQKPKAKPKAIKTGGWPVRLHIPAGTRLIDPQPSVGWKVDEDA